MTRRGPRRKLYHRRIRTAREVSHEKIRPAACSINPLRHGAGTYPGGNPPPKPDLTESWSPVPPKVEHRQNAGPAAV